MKRILTVALFALMAWTAADAQTALKRVYDEQIDPMVQIDKALEQARGEEKFVVCQLGGNWCPWCLRFADFITNDTTINKMVTDNFVYIHVNYNPRKSAGQGSVDQSQRLLKRLGNPARFGFPVFVVLDENGKVMHIQDSSFLEQGKGYDKNKVLRFFRNWTPKAVKGE